MSGYIPRYDKIQDAPDWHRVVAAYYSTGKMTVAQIADALDKDKNVIASVLRHPPVVTHVERLRNKAIAKELDLTASMLELRDEAMESIREIFTDNKASPTVKLRAAGMVLDRDPEALFVKQGKSTTVNTLNIYDSEKILEVKERALALGAARVIDVSVEEERDETGIGDGDGGSGGNGNGGAAEPVETVEQGVER